MLFSAGAVVLDIGAHHGQQLTEYVMLGRAKRVIAVEPLFPNYMQLLLTVQKFGNVVIPVHAAASNVEGISRIYPAEQDTALSTLDPEQWLAVYPDVKFAKCEFVPTVTIETLTRVFGQFDYIKIDTEGLEELVLEGMTTSTPPTISFEFHKLTIPAAVRSLLRLKTMGYDFASYIEDEAPVTYFSEMSLDACIKSLQKNSPAWGNIVVRRQL